jgi:hypothetical protein
MSGGRLSIRLDVPETVHDPSNFEGVLPMYSDHIQAALAIERRKTLLVEAQAARQAKQARSSDQRAGASSHWARRWAQRRVAIRLKSPALTTDQPARSRA